MFCHEVFFRMSLGETSKYLLETGDFLQKNVKCMLVEFCRSVTPSQHVRVTGHLGDDSQLLLYYTWLCLFVEWRKQSSTFCKGLNVSRMQTLVRFLIFLRSLPLFHKTD